MKALWGRPREGRRGRPASSQSPTLASAKSCKSRDGRDFSPGTSIQKVWKALTHPPSKLLPAAGWNRIEHPHGKFLSPPACGAASP